jgi:hypothetical protein
MKTNFFTPSERLGIAYKGANAEDHGRQKIDRGGGYGI